MTSSPPETPAGAAPRRRRPRTTSPRVHLVDRATTAAITVGGISVIAAVMGILAYLVVVVSPLFGGATLEAEASYPLVPADRSSRVLFTEIDEYKALGALVTSTGELRTFAARDGTPVETGSLFPSPVEATAFSQTGSEGLAAFGFGDGTVILGRISFDASFVSDQGAMQGEIEILPDGVRQRLGGDAAREVRLDVSLDAPIQVGEQGAGILLLDYRSSRDGSRLVTLDSSGRVSIAEISERENLMTGEITRERNTSSFDLPEELRRRGDPGFLLGTSLGDQIYLAWHDGTVARYSLDPDGSPRLVERKVLLDGSSSRLTVFRFMTGEQSLLTGDSSGRTSAWFRVRRTGSSLDGSVLVRAHEFFAMPGSVSVMATSARDKTFLVADEKGTLALSHLTSERRLASDSISPPAAIVMARITPKGDGVFALAADGRGMLWSVDNPHPETSLSGIFGKVWYEGHDEPAYTWQSSSASDDFEPKLSLIPLLFGTIKATLYSMLFAVPVALLAAIYTSEFMDPRYRAGVKSTIEVMASLPSVVLGFLAALILAPFIESWVLAVFVGFALIPLSALGMGYLWQMIPLRISLRLGTKTRLALIAATVLGSLAAARYLAGPVESLLFHGSFNDWLDGQVGTGAPGIGLAIWPLLMGSLLILDRRYLAEGVSRRLGSPSRARAAALETIKYALLVGVSIVLAWGIAVTAAALGLDLRGLLFGTYVQRNALIVGFVMGFAVIPIIYTIAEDALSSVPRTLRSASLGCGATRWQTATRVVLPVAVSGIFSALMVGLGRAVGETMIVLMAAGNTPIMDFNIFNGLRTLSANIAVELPEAAKDGSLYRMLFLAALLLFLMTFLVNTVAEIIRQKFRKKAFQL